MAWIPTAEASVQPSFRDPDGFVFGCGDRILRCVFPHATNDLRLFLSSTLAVTWRAERMLSDATLLIDRLALDLPSNIRERIPDDAIILEHEPIRFPSYPYEWAPEMLRSAAALILRMGQEALDLGFGLKDATPYNIMFEGPSPIFIDVLSFERRDSLDPIWRPFAQFVRTLIYPLLANRYFGLQLNEILLAHRDGLEPERILRLCPAWRLLLPPFFGAVTIPALLARYDDGYDPRRFRTRRAKEPTEAKFLLDRLFRRANRLLRSAFDPAPKKAASFYAESGHTYTGQALAAKEQTVAEAVQRFRSRAVLDIGSHTGRFSVVAASHGASVVAIDHDTDVVGTLWRSASQNGLDVLPLVIDIARPPGACGWANREFPSFLDRARGRFDCVLLLALLHHLLVNEGVPLENIFELAANLTTSVAVIEYVDPADSQFQRITRGREALHRTLTRQSFEASARQRFEILDSRELGPTRRIYTLHKKRG